MRALREREREIRPSYFQLLLELRNFARFGTLENNLRAPRRCMSTCEELDERTERNDVAGPIKLHQQVVKWHARGLCLQECYHEVCGNFNKFRWISRNFAQFGLLENNLRAPRRCMSTCEELDEQMERDDVAGQIQIHKASRRSSPTGIRKKSQQLNGRLRWSPKGQDETHQKASQTMHTHNSYTRVHDRDDSSDGINDTMEDNEEDEASMEDSDMDSDDDGSTVITPKEILRGYEDNEEDEASMEDSDMDSDDDGSTVITPKEILRGVEKDSLNNLTEKEQENARKQMIKKLISDALDGPEENEDDPIQEDEQQSLRVGIIGAVNSGKSSLTNFMVGTKVAAVSRKRNTTLSEILGVVTKGNTQILLYDTPGLVLDILGRPSKTDTRRRSESAWQLFSHCEIILVLVDAYRQIHKPDKRVLRLVERLGTDENPYPRRVLVFNKVDIIENKKQLLPLAQQFEKLPGYECIFMISALTGSGVKDILKYLIDQAVSRPWEEEPDALNEETIRTLSMEIVREHLLDRVHEEIPYELDHQLVDWQELEDGSLRIEQHFNLPKKGQCRIVVGKGGSKIREIGTRACEELRRLLNRKVHLFLEVKHGGGV